MGELKIYGYSDDNVVFTGIIDDEIGCYGCGEEYDEYLSISDGTLLSVAYGGDGTGCWRFKLLYKGSAFQSIDPGVDDDEALDRPDNIPAYSDLVILDGDIKWIIFHDKYLKAK